MTGRESSTAGDSAQSGTVRVLGYDVRRVVSSEAEERTALGSAAGVLHAPWERLLEVRGPDAASFLHVLLTQHIRGLSVGDRVRAALANRKGHLEADLVVHRAGEDRFLLRVPSIAAERVWMVLETHRILEDVSFHWPYDDPDAFLVLGPDARRIVSAATHHDGGADGPCGDEPRTADPGADGPRGDEPIGNATPMPVDEVGPDDVLLVFERDGREAVLDRLREAGAAAIGWDTFDRLRIERGRAWFGIDADEERLVPEPGYGDRIHYDKGCYLGQEPLARLHFRGKPNWELVRLHSSSDDAPPKGTALVDADGERVGWLTSAAASAWLRGAWVLAPEVP
ncbi:MAG: hypothetical protein R3E97_18720 [Candidatus Eisenbacteria bacterium]